MASSDLVKNINSLIQLDIDAARAYTQAIAEIPEADIRQTLSRFRDDHNRHVADLSQWVRDMGEVPPTYSPDLKGFFIENFTAIRSKAGTESALKAMQDNEKLTNKTYRDALGWDLTPVALNLIEKNYRDEQGHLSYIVETLAGRAWEQPAARPLEQPYPEERPGQPGA